jgi:putative MATE family efflux protein
LHGGTGALPGDGVSVRERWNSRAVFQLIWPLVIEQVLGVTIGLVDTMMMAAVGEHAVSGVSLVDAIATLLIIAFGALATGGSVVISQYLGRGKCREAEAAARQLLYISFLTALGIMGIALLFRSLLLRLIYGTIAPEVTRAAETYFFFSALGYPALAVYNASAALFRSMGNSRVTMTVSVFMNLLHVLGNILLIYVLPLGVSGAALSTLASRILGGAVLLALLVRGRGRLISLAGLFKVRSLRLEPSLIRGILRVGIPSGIESSLFQFGKILVSRLAAFFGTAAIAANAVTGSINAFIIMPGNAFGMAIVTIVGQCVGAGDYQSARFFTRRLMFLTYLTVSALALGNIVFMDALVGLFKLSPEAHAMTSRFLHTVCVMMILTWPSSFTLPNALRAAGDVKFVMAVAIVSMWLVRVSGAYIASFSLGFGVIGIWYAWVADWVFRSVFFIHRWLSGAWQNKHILPEN